MAAFNKKKSQENVRKEAICERLITCHIPPFRDLLAASILQIIDCLLIINAASLLIP